MLLLPSSFSRALINRIGSSQPTLFTTRVYFSYHQETMAFQKKESGNALFSSGDFAGAIAEYSAGLQCDDKTTELTCVLLTNRAACYLKVQEYEKCVADCDQALSLDKGLSKAFYRRAKARSEINGQLEKAFEDANRCVTLNPSDAASVALFRSLRARVAQSLESQGAYETPAAQLAHVLATTEESGLEDSQWKRAAAAAAEDDSGAATMWRKGACAAALRSNSPSAIRLVAACCARKNVPIDAGKVHDWLPKCSAEVPAVAIAARFAEESEDGADGLSRIAGLALSCDDPKVRDAGMELLVRWLAPSIAEPATSREDRADAKRRVETSRAKCARRVAAETLLAEKSRRWPEALWELLESPDSGERRKAQAVLARMMRAIARKATPDKLYDLEWQVDDPEECGPHDLSNFFFEFKGGGVELSRRKRLASFACGCHLASSRFSALAMELGFENPAADLMRMIHVSSDEVAQALGAEALSAAASSEEGRALLEPLVASGALESLMEAKDLPNVARSAAAGAVAKLGLAAKALKAGADETGRLLDAAVALLREGGDGDGPEETDERAVEVLAAMSSNSAVKEELAHGSGRVSGNALEAVCSKLAKARGEDALAYSVASLFASVTVTNNELRQRHFREREMDITPEQYDEFQRITKQKAAEDADVDTEELCSKRCRKLVLCDGVSLISRLASTSPSLNTAEKLAETLVNLAKDVELRGTLVQQGGFKAAVDLASESYSKPARTNASHAAAKILVTTNPHVLTDAQRLSAVRPLLWLCKQYDVSSSLMHFEACLAITNLGSLGDAAKARIAAEKGIATLEYLQFSNHEMVQRAATEALCNMVPNPDFLEHLKKKDKLKLWFALSLEYEKDLALSRAAVGCVAMASTCPDMPKFVVDAPSCLPTLSELVQLPQNKYSELVHRSVFCVENLARHPDSRQQLFGSSDLPSLLEKGASSVSPRNETLRAAFGHALQALKEEDDSATTTK